MSTRDRAGIGVSGEPDNAGHQAPARSTFVKPALPWKALDVDD
jgi:hypothetical protein